MFSPPNGDQVGGGREVDTAGVRMKIFNAHIFTVF